ncbi:Ger(x)C family spore germination protein [Paenibacillus arenilitoris]|uniref:Ger(X)C family spore germination protein n=1 Tax=Paenibacillus arenilitoris TaxID=2772299 RepID=A0A927H8H1_9BACL|nr:Ger(x)C family spore germination protein [Paenibacillus arenilitoris]MBD2872075.1 Ger(x)C family spore germination protein [Paenibacillus arenilitoris]
MKWKVSILMLVFLLILSGCWNKEELDEAGFVMAVALDRGKKEPIDMTTQMYRPVTGGSSKGKGASPKSSSLLIKTSNSSIFEAVRDIPLHLGRKAQWSHMRILLIGEELARTTDIGELIDFFYRDHEPRHTVSILITSGRADRILSRQPVIEQTTGQQIALTQQFSLRNSAKSLDTTLLDLALQMNAPHNDTAVAYVYEDKRAEDKFVTAGLALVKKGKLTGVLPSKKVEGLVMLINQYKSGIIEIACPGQSRRTESMEVLDLKTKLKPKEKDGKVNVKVKTVVRGATGELRCTEIKTREDEEKFVRKMEEEIKKQMSESIRYLQLKKTDIIGIGNMLYRANPKQWETMKGTWDRQFAETTFELEVKVTLVTTGTVINKPAVSGDGNK